MVLFNTLIIINLFFVFLCFLPKFNLNNQPTSISIFAFNLIGYLYAIMLVYSSIKSNGKSILLFSLPILIVTIVYHYKSLKVNWLFNKQEWNYLFITLIVANCIFIIKSFFLFQFDSDYLKIPHPDYVFYAKLSSYFKNTGIESVFFNSNISPYHFFEIELTAMFTEIFHYSYSCLMLITYPVLLTFCFILSLSLFDYDNYPKKAICLSVLVLILKLIYIPVLYDSFHFLKASISFLVNPWSYQKISVIYLVVLLALNGYKKYGVNSFLLILSFFPFVYGSTIFGVFGVFCGALFMRFWNKNSIKWFSILMLFCAIVSYNLYYKLSGFQNHFILNLNVLLEFSSIKIVCATIVKLSLFAFPLVILLLYFNKTKCINVLLKHYKVFFLVFLGVFSSLFAWVLFQNSVDTLQFFTNFSLPFLCLFLVCMISYLAYNYIYIIVCFFIMLTFYKSNFENITFDLAKTEHLFKKYTKGAFIKNAEDYKNIYLINPNYANPMPFSFLINESISMEDLSMVDVNLKTGENIELLSTYLKINELKRFQENNKISGIEAKVNFIKEKQIQFLIIPKSYKLPFQMAELFKNSIKVKEGIIYYN